MTREYTNKLLEKIENGELNAKQIIDEMLCFFSEDTIKDFCLTSFGNEGVFTDDEIKEIEGE